MTTEVKICGITTREALDAALQNWPSSGLRYVGLIFFKNSPRNVDFTVASELADVARTRVEVVALLVDPDDDLVRKVGEKIHPDLLQLHGTETVERVREIRRLFNRPIIKAVGVATSEDVEAGLQFFKPGELADVLLFDAKPPKGAGRPGGHGVAFDWSILSKVPRNMHWMLSGGLRRENVTEAIRATGAGVVDVSSGVESAPGVKDPELIRRFLRAVKTTKQG
jgi:phosphoribosylanthranilate isomerase